MNTTPLPTMNSFAKSIYSQSGEDGIIEQIFLRIQDSAPPEKWCVEFGAMDGILYSNAYNLIRNKNYRAVLIESDTRKYKKLCENIPQENVLKLCQFVTLEGASSLDSILRNTPIPFDFDFLSIDIDGCDYHVFESLKDYEPKVICIEFNQHIPNEIEFVQPADFSVKQGSSAKSIIGLAAEKGYFLAALTASNLIFVRDEFKSAVGESDLETLRDDSECRTLIFFGYDGTLLCNRDAISVPWHRLTVSSDKLQVVPRYLRHFGEDYSYLQKILFAVFVLIRFPGNFRGLFREKIQKKWQKHR